MPEFILHPYRFDFIPVNISLTIAGNEIVIAKDIDPSRRNSLGMHLMKTLSEQLDGTIKIENKEGTFVKACSGAR